MYKHFKHGVPSVWCMHSYIIENTRINSSAAKCKQTVYICQILPYCLLKFLGVKRVYFYICSIISVAVKYQKLNFRYCEHKHPPPHIPPPPPPTEKCQWFFRIQRLKFQRITAQHTQVHLLRLSWGSVRGSYCSNSELCALSVRSIIDAIL